MNAWQLDNPDATKAECEGWIKNRWNGEGRVEWESQCPRMEKGKAEKRKR